jgi:hypothetical protein
MNCLSIHHSVSSLMHCSFHTRTTTYNNISILPNVHHLAILQILHYHDIPLCTQPTASKILPFLSLKKKGVFIIKHLSEHVLRLVRNQSITLNFNTNKCTNQSQQDLNKLRNHHKNPFHPSPCPFSPTPTSTSLYVFTD